MDRLKKMDPVAYVRFASVYREFRDADIFMESVSEKGGTQPAGYTRLLGEGRLCALTPGHTLDVWENEQFMRMFTSAMEWCLKER